MGWGCLRHGLLADEPLPEGGKAGLRIALATQFGEDAALLRSTAMANLALLTFRGRTHVTEADLRERTTASCVADNAGDSCARHLLRSHLGASICRAASSSSIRLASSIQS